MQKPLSLLVTDTNIWIDLDNGGILFEVFQLPYKLITSDFAITELMRPGWQSLMELGLEFVELEPNLVSELYQLRGVYHHLSTVDLASYLVARQLKTMLVTGDHHLKQLAAQNGLTVHGIIWFLDEMVRLEILAPQTTGEALQKIIAHGARLPIEECNKRLNLWG